MIRSCALEKSGIFLTVRESLTPTSQKALYGMEQTLEIAQTDFHGLCFVNLVDFDALWGHRRDPEGYAREIEKFDVNLGRLLDLMKKDDLLIITADHGNDPTYTGTDHTRERFPSWLTLPLRKGGAEIRNRKPLRW